MSKFWLTVGVIVLAVFSLGAAQSQPRAAAADLPDEVTETLQGQPLGTPSPSPSATPKPTPTAKPVAKPEPAEKAAPAPAPAPQPQPRPALVGTVGYATPGGNCVNEPGVNNPGYGNPINWPVTSQEPFIGATALFTWNHVGVVTGIWANGDVEVRHQNYYGGQTRFPRSMIRGYR